MATLVVMKEKVSMIGIFTRYGLLCALCQLSGAEELNYLAKEKLYIMLGFVYM